jgi:hypothetical protein
MGTKSREAIYGSSIRASVERAKEARKEADRLACVAWNQRMLGFQGPAQPSPALGDALQCLRVEIGPDPKRVRGRATATTWRRKLCASTSRRVDIMPVPPLDAAQMYRSTLQIPACCWVSAIGRVEPAAIGSNSPAAFRVNR